jgi:hypothetical protein
MRTPVVFLIFNRPDFTKKVFGEIAKFKPNILLVVADGPRSDRPGEAQRCIAAREVIEHVDWDCDVLRNFSDINLGNGRRVSSGLMWAFTQVEEAIILEDDTLPHPSFFPFCEELLEKYRNDQRVMHISGNNFQFGRLRGPYSYYFSRYDHIWGYATWRRAFQHYDFEMKLWPTLRETAWLLDILGDELAARWWKNYFDLAWGGDRELYDAYDCQWVYSIWVQNGLSITPNTNLVSNIGFGADSTRTKLSDHPLSNIPTAAMAFPLLHPPHRIRDVEADRLAFEQACMPKPATGSLAFCGDLHRQALSVCRVSLLTTFSIFRRLGRIFQDRLRRPLRVAVIFARLIKILLFRLVHQSDYKRWTNPDNLETWWDSRSEKLAQLIPRNTRVIEFGAGRRQLEGLLNQDCRYIPSDLVDRGPGTIVFDLNRRPLPDLRYVKADVAVFSGVLEYVRDLQSLVEWLSNQVSFCVVSYAYVHTDRRIVRNVRDHFKRIYYGYMNNYTEKEFLKLFDMYGFLCKARDTWNEQRIFAFVNEGRKCFGYASKDILSQIDLEEED